MKRKKPYVGQQLFSLNVGNAARRNIPQVLVPVLVTKVGRKYFYAKPKGLLSRLATQYHIDTWNEKTEYTEDSKLFESKEEYEDSAEAASLCKFIGDSFRYGVNMYCLSVEQLRDIKEIMEQ